MAASSLHCLLPAQQCCCCDKTLEEAGGGYRVISSHFTGLHIEAGILVKLWGSCWTEQARYLAEESLKSGKHPWVCQMCADVGVCRLCRCLLDYVGGIDVLGNEGEYFHAPLLPVAYPRCTNTQCSTHARGLVSF